MQIRSHFATYEKACEYCGRKFTSKRAHAKCCSSSCRVWLSEKKRLAEATIEKPVVINSRISNTVSTTQKYVVSDFKPDVAAQFEKDYKLPFEHSLVNQSGQVIAVVYTSPLYKEKKLVLYLNRTQRWQGRLMEQSEYSELVK